MKFALKFVREEQHIVFDDLEFGKIHYIDGYDIIDSKFLFVNELQREELMEVYNQQFIDDDKGGAPAHLIRQNGMTVIGRVFIYPTEGLHAKIHISVEN